MAGKRSDNKFEQSVHGGLLVVRQDGATDLASRLQLSPNLLELQIFNSNFSMR